MKGVMEGERKNRQGGLEVLFTTISERYFSILCLYKEIP